MRPLPLRFPLPVVLVLALALVTPALVTPAPALADHAQDTDLLSTRWVRHGFNEGWRVRALDLDGDGSDEIVYGGRKLAVLDEHSLGTGRPRFAVRWSHEPGNQLDGGDNVWVTGVEAAGDALYVTSGDTDAYALDPRTGFKRWHNPRTGTGLSDGFALVDAPGDSTPDLFPTGGTSAVSGATGEALWSLELRRGVKVAVSAELDGDAGRELLVASDPSGVAIGQELVFAVGGDGRVLGRFAPNSVVESLAAGDVDGDGIDEMIVGTATGWVYAVAADGTPRWVAFAGLGRVEPVVALDIDGDRRDEVIAGYRTPSEDDPANHVVAYDDTGAPLWRHVIGLPVAVIEPAQLDADAAPEVIVGAGTRFNLATRGEAVALETGVADVARERWRIPTHKQVMSAATTVQHGRRLALLGSADAILRAVDAATGAEVWRWHAGGYVFATAAGDLDGDGTDEVAKSGDDGAVVALAADGAERWSRRADIGNNGIVRGLAMGDADGDGRAETAVAGTRFAAERRGVVELYRPDGTRRWSVLLHGGSEDVEIADLDGDGSAEVIAGEAAGLDAECAVNAFDSRTGALLWRTPVAACLVAVIDVGDVDGDGILEVAYGDRTLASQPHLALLRADGSLVWNKGIAEQVFWVEAVADGVVHGGFTFGQQGSVTRRDRAGEPRWQTTLPDDEDYGSASRFATLVPHGGGAYAIAASADDGAVYLLSGEDGSVAWSTRLEPRDLRFQDRHPAGPIVHLPAAADRPGRLVVGQYHIGRRRAEAFALSLDGAVLGAAPLEGEAQAAAAMRSRGAAPRAVIGAGLGVYAFDAHG